MVEPTPVRWNVCPDCLGRHEGGAACHDLPDIEIAITADTSAFEIGVKDARITALESQVTALRKRAEEAERKLAELEGALNWQTSCLACSRVLDSAYAETVRAEQAETERAALTDRNRNLDTQLTRERQGRLAAEAAVRRIRTFLEDMRTWCSPYGVAADYAERALAALDADQPKEETAHAGNGNAEDCPVCRPLIDQPGGVLYPWLCTAADQPEETP